MVYLKKVSLYIDEELWARFKEAVLRKHGTLRKLSMEVENLLRELIAGEEVERGLRAVGARAGVLTSPEEVKKRRPRLRGPPSEEIIRGMRVVKAIPRQQRDS